MVDQNYLSVYNTNGYYFKPDFLELFDPEYKLQKTVTVPNYEIKLEELSKKLLSKNENILPFMNAIYLRNIIAISHYALIKNILPITQLLIEELEALNSR